MADTSNAPLLAHGHAPAPLDLASTFGAPLGIVSAVLVVAIGCFATYADSDATDAHVNQYYMWYIHVALMIFVGFGYLMTFLKRYAQSAVALNFAMSALVMVEFLLVGGAVQQLWSPEGGFVLKKVELNLPLVVDSAFCAGAAMITFGAVLGKVTPGQLTWLLVLEVPFYAINQKIVFDVLKGLDIGGSMSIHAFGAYYGLAATMLLSKPGSGSGHSKNGATYISDITAMIGTIALFIFWPSFNAALASNPDLAELPVQTQFYCVTNTILSLLGATLATFAASAFLEGKLNMVHVQNSTLAGGVAVGSAANLKILPGGALAIGFIAGTVSVLGYVYVQPYLESKIKLKDTCGVHNLHGMPGIMGGLAAALASVLGYSANAAVLEAASHGTSTYLFQLAALGCSLAIALVGGYLAALFVELVTPKDKVLSGPYYYEDAVVFSEVELDTDEVEKESYEAVALAP